MKHYKAILIDWDQTIGDWEGAEYQALHDLYEQHRLSEWYDSFATYLTTYKEKNIALWGQYGRGEITRHFLHRERFLYPMLHALGLSVAPQPMIDLANQMGCEFLQATNQYFCLLPAAADTIRQLASKYALTVVSNGFSEVQYYKLEASGLKDCFRHVVISDEVGVNKPQAGIFEEALRRNQVNKEEAVMIGDNYASDIAGAKAAGIDQIWVTWGKAKNEGEKATYEVTELAEVLTIL